MLICSFSPAQRLFFPSLRTSLPSIPPIFHPATTTSAVGSSWTSWRGFWGMTIRSAGQRLLNVQRGLTGTRWTDNLVVWPAAGWGSRLQMITQSEHYPLAALHQNVLRQTKEYRFISLPLPSLQTINPLFSCYIMCFQRYPQAHMLGWIHFKYF